MQLRKRIRRIVKHERISRSGGLSWTSRIIWQTSTIPSMSTMGSSASAVLRTLASRFARRYCSLSTPLKRVIEHCNSACDALPLLQFMDESVNGGGRKYLEDSASLIAMPHVIEVVGVLRTGRIPQCTLRHSPGHSHIR